MLQDYIELEVEAKQNELHVHGKLHEGIEGKTKVETREVMLEMMDRGYSVIRILNGDEVMPGKREGHWVFQLQEAPVGREDIVDFLDDYKSLGSYLADEAKGKTPRKTEERQKKLLDHLKEKINGKK